MEGCIIDFFKKSNLYDEEEFNNIIKNTTIIHKDYDEIKDIVGCYFCKPNSSIRVLLPEIKTFRDILIHIHEYTHAITKSEDEILPNMLEALYIRQNLDSPVLLEDIIKYTENEIEKSISKEHTFAKKIKLELIKKKY